MQLDWRAIAGPALAAATTLTAIAIDHRLFGVPNPAALLVCIVAFAGSLSGLRSAAVSAAIAIAGPRCSSSIIAPRPATKPRT